jgi:competence protein ComEC
MNKRRVITISFVFASIFLLLYINGLAAPTNETRVSFIDVGQGDATLIRDQSGYDVLIDGGKVAAGPTVAAYLRDQGVDDVDVMIASHADSDHIGGLISVLQMADIPVESVLYNGYPGDTSTWYTFATAVANEGITMNAAQFPQTFTWGSSIAHIMNPVSGLSNPDQNDASVVVLLDSGNVEYLFTGDIGTSTEADIVARGTPIASDVLKVAHHGSKYASSSDFLAAVQPKDAAISVGDNPYGHPTNETLSRLLAAGAEIWRTDEQGTILVVSDGTTYSVVPEIAPLPPALSVYLPLLLRSEPQPTPSPTTPPPTEEPTDTPEPTETQPPPPSNIQITYIFYDGVVPYVESDEYAQITNEGNGTVNLEGWRLNAGDPGQDFIFPSYNMQPGQSCRVYTNEYHPESCGFSFGSSKALWNNSGDCGRLYDSGGSLADEYCY